MEILKSFYKRILLISALIILYAPHSFYAAHAAEPIRLHENKIKAGLLYNFLKYTSWPEKNDYYPNNDIHVCLWQSDSLDGTLNPLDGRTAQKKNIKILTVQTMDELAFCHVLYIGKNESNDLYTLMPTLTEFELLTMSDIEGFAKNGGMVEFTKGADQRIHISINRPQVHMAGLSMQDRLLRIAQQVR